MEVVNTDVNKNKEAKTLGEILFHWSTWCSLGKPSKLSFSCPKSSLLFILNLLPEHLLFFFFLLLAGKWFFSYCYFTLDLAAFKPWAPSITRGCCFDYLRDKDVAQSKMGQDHGRDNTVLEDRAFHSRFWNHQLSMHEKEEPGKGWPSLVTILSHPTVPVEGSTSRLPHDVSQYIPSALSSWAWDSENRLSPSSPGTFPCEMLNSAWTSGVLVCH